LSIYCCCIVFHTQTWKLEGAPQSRGHHNRGLVGGGHGGRCGGGRSGGEFGLPPASSIAQWPNNIVVDLLENMKICMYPMGTFIILFLGCESI
jgi:hypothetical protein